MKFYVTDSDDDGYECSNTRCAYNTGAARCQILYEPDYAVNENGEVLCVAERAAFDLVAAAQMVAAQKSEWLARGITG